ncbi:putative RNA helicase [Tieghemostelium lacteum]|uniref:Putative RNA helicase n=1 Tax=Tieghemostelium lacteum TaxID=361077 RepID=A0A151Z7C5_TIELA|nr:putative RNA helicase [Tieghemostelium lacteum]|eukprot:KYQ89862.1 putative RNA helicase [Tieghemostelium lacteum]
MIFSNYLYLYILEFLAKFDSNYEYTYHFIKKFRLVSIQWNKEIIPKIRYPICDLPVSFSKRPNIKKVKLLMSVNIQFKIGVQDHLILDIYIDQISKHVAEILCRQAPQRETLDKFENLKKLYLNVEIGLGDSSPYDLKEYQEKGVIIDMMHKTQKIPQNSDPLEYWETMFGNRYKSVSLRNIHSSIEGYLQRHPMIYIEELTLEYIEISKESLFCLIDCLVAPLSVEYDQITFTDEKPPKFDEIIERVAMSRSAKTLEELYFVFPELRTSHETLSKNLPLITNLRLLSLIMIPDQDFSRSDNIILHENTYDIRVEKLKYKDYSKSNPQTLMYQFRDHKALNIYMTSCILSPYDSDIIHSEISQSIVHISAFTNDTDPKHVQFTNQMIQCNWENCDKIRLLNQLDGTKMNAKTFHLSLYIESLQLNSNLTKIHFEGLGSDDLLLFLRANHPTIRCVKVFNIYFKKYYKVKNIADDDEVEVEEEDNDDNEEGDYKNRQNIKITEQYKFDFINLLQHNQTLEKLKIITDNLSYDRRVENIDFMIPILRQNRTLIKLILPFNCDTDPTPTQLLDLETILQSNTIISSLNLQSRKSIFLLNKYLRKEI